MGKYQTYLDSDVWKKKRRATIARTKSREKSSAVFQCERCKSFFRADSIQVHHNHYKSLGSKRKNDLQVLCMWCHSEIHSKPCCVNKSAYMLTIDRFRTDISDGEMNAARNAAIDLLARLT